MAQIVECVPNFSEGRRPEVIDAIIREIQTVPDVRVLDHEMDKDHNRAVLTFIGPPQNVKEAAFRGICKATELIDMEKHTGEHPRVGATDVVPFVPVSGVTLQDCKVLAQELGAEVGEKLQIPVYLYEAAAKRPDRENLADVRRGEYEGFKATIETDPNRVPDFGPRRMHPTAGAIIIGARPFLIAFNVYLGTDNVAVARRIAKAIRFRSGGLRYLKALGFEIRDRGLVQVSMNLTNFDLTPIYRVFEMIKSEADRWGVPIASSEIVGLAPLKAVIDVADFYLKFENFSVDQILENKLLGTSSPREKSMQDFITEVASSSPAPGGGSVAALAATLCCALASMVCRLTVGKKRFEEVSEELGKVLLESEGLRKRAEQLIVEDTESFNNVMRAMKMPKDSEPEKEKRKQAVQEATKRATLVPLEVMELSREALRLVKVIAEKGNPNSVSDAGVATAMARTACFGASLNVRINLGGIEDAEFREKRESRMKAVLEEVDSLYRETMAIVESKL
jgi:glutamate formiminotransferase/formiminotetrahydrofolate cyclodeaminase